MSTPKGFDSVYIYLTKLLIHPLTLDNTFVFYLPFVSI